jgi:hypothetical protein
MKIWYILQTFFTIPAIISGRLLQPKTDDFSFLNGNWLQIYSSKFVQESTEIDWDCVDVSITVDSTNQTVNITKSAILHNHVNLLVHQTRMYHQDTVNNTLSLSPIGSNSTIIPNLVMKHIEPNYIIITGSDYLTMIVLTRDYASFFESNNNDALQLLKSFNYTTYYKYPQISYNPFCME